MDKRYKSFTNKKFWDLYDQLPDDVQRLADKSYKLFSENPSHNSLHFKKVGKTQPVYSVRITDKYRSLGYILGDGIYWFWIGNHRDYELLPKTI